MGAETLDLLWRNALGVLPVALVIAAVCRMIPCRPSTRHTLWLGALVALLMPAALLSAWAPELPTAEEHSARLLARSQPERRADLTPAPLTLEELLPLVTGEPAAERQEAHALDTAPRPTLKPFSRSIGSFAGALTTAPARDRAIEIDITAEPFASEFAQPRRAAPAGRAFPAPALRSSSPVQRHAPAPDRLATPIIADMPASAGDLGLAAPMESMGAPPIGATADIALSSLWDEWAIRALSLRDALLELPAIPASVWLGGAGLIALIGVGRVFWFQRTVRVSAAADPEIRALVAIAAHDMGLRRTPEVRMTEARISPMIWCGRRALLLLPTPLWSDLDEIGRRAVLCHELAHLKRRDHWVCWIESLASVLYWWHPLVWFIRRRLREEADLCCDLWVTALLPRHRRAYAEALVQTRAYISESGRGTPVMGLGAASVRARRFARRLTMIMTTSGRPRLSLSGMSLAAVVAAAGMVATPLWACPNPEKEKAGVVSVAHPGGHGEGGSAGKNKEAKESEETTFERHLRERAHEHGGDDADEGQDFDFDFDFDFEWDGESFEQLEAELERLGEELERMFEELSESDEWKSAQEKFNSQALHEYMGALREHMHGLRSTGRGHATAPAAPRGEVRVSPTTPAPPAIAGEQGSTFFHLEGGKLEDLTRLMVRSDVPVLVRPSDDGIEVLGTERERRIFAAFLSIIDPEGREPVAGVLAAPMAPGEPAPPRGLARVRSHDDDDCTPSRNRAAVHSHDDDDCTPSRAHLAEQHIQRMAEQQARMHEQQARLQERLAQRQARTIERQAMAQQRAAERTGQLHERHAQRLQQLAERAAQLDAQSGEMDARASEFDGRAAELQARLQEALARLEAEQNTLSESQAQEIGRMVEMLQRQAEEAAQRAEQMRERAHELRQSAQERRDATGEVDDELQSAIEALQEELESALAGLDDEMEGVAEEIQTAMEQLADEINRIAEEIVEAQTAAAEAAAEAAEADAVSDAESDDEGDEDYDA